MVALEVPEVWHSICRATLAWLGVQCAQLPLDPTVCHSPACQFASKNLQQSINFSVNPCDNFYQYACGNWAKTHTKINDYERLNPHKVREKKNANEILAFLKKPDDPDEPKCVHTSRKVFKSCLDTSILDSLGDGTLKEMLKIVNLTSSPPIVSNGTDFDLLLTTARMQNLLGIGMLYGITVSPDPRNASRNLISIMRADASRFSLALSTSSFANETKHEIELNSIRDAYISTAFQVLCENSTSEVCNTMPLDKVLQVGFARSKLEKYIRKLYRIKSKPSPRNSMGVTMEYITVGKLQNFSDQIALEKKATSLNWTRSIELVFQGAHRVNLTLRNDTKLLIERSYMEDILHFIYSYSAADHELGAWWTVVDSFADFGSSRLRDAKMRLMKIWEGEVSRETWCLKAVSYLQGPVLSYYYSVNSVYKETKSKVMEMAGNIHVALWNLMNETSWVDKQHKKKFWEKLNTMKFLVAFPNTTYNDTLSYGMFLDIVNPAPEKNLTDNFLNFMLTMIRGYTSYRLSALYVKNEATDWGDNTFFYTIPMIRVSADYYLERNTLIIPGGILGQPFYGNGGLDALNYGSMGTIVGHQMIHGFDIVGRFYDKHGELENWWEPEMLDQFKIRAKCQANECDVKTAPNAWTTLEEKIAEVSGFRVALYAYESLYHFKNLTELPLIGFKNYTHHQLFTLAYASTYCESPGAITDRDTFRIHGTNEARVNSVLVNSGSIFNIWNCTRDSPMGAKIMPHYEECYVW